jgi:hypothetical protein
MKKLIHVLIFTALASLAWGQSPVLVTGTDSAGLPRPLAADIRGYLSVQQDASPVLFEDFGAPISAVKWAATSGTGGTSPTWTTDSAGTVLNAGTTLNGFSLLSSVPTVFPVEPSFIRIEWREQLLSNISTTTYNFWGLANTPAVPTIANAVVDGCGFDELQSTTKLMAVCYQGTSGTTGARVVIQDLSGSTGNNTQPNDLTAVHKYDLFFSGALSFWLIDGKVVATMPTGANGPNFNTLSAVALSVSNSGTANTQTANGVAVGDTSKRQTTLCDPISTWQCALVGTTGALSTVFNGSAAVGQATLASSQAALTTAVVVKASAGNLYGFQVTNSSASVCYLEFINAASAPTLGTATTYSFAVPATGTLTLPPSTLALSNYATGISVGIATTYNGAAACAAATAVIFYK